MEIRVLTALDADAFWALRLRALQDHPAAFGASYTATVSTPSSVIRQRLQEGEGSPDSYILGAFLAGTLVGMIGFHREPGDKLRHSGTIWGLYVIPEARTQGIAKALFFTVLIRAISLAALEQIHLSVVTANQAARQLYLSVGFTVWGYDPHALKVDGQYLAEESLVLHLVEEEGAL